MLLYQYKSCGGHNNHCSVPPEVIKFTRAKTELFGSPFNTCLEQYCSPFYDIECHFGSLGSFFNFEFQTGTYIMNPPYDEVLMDRAVDRILHVLSGSDKSGGSGKEITIIVVFPLWDRTSQIEHRGTHYDKDFAAYEKLKSSKFLTSAQVLNHNTHKFYDYFVADYTPVADAHLMVLSNTIYQLTAVEIANYWAEHVTS